jgi:UTP--glucose-1-phosphate uridylyltransferase
VLNPHLDPVIFSYLEKQVKTYKGNGEFKVQDAMQQMINEGHKFYGYEIQNGKFYDTGNKLEYMKTVIDFALKHEEFEEELLEHIRAKLG